PSDLCMRPIESNSIRSNADNREPRRLEHPHLALESNSPRTIFFVSELSSSCSCATDNRGDSVPAGDERVPLTRMQKPVGEASRKKSGPETVSRFREMKSRRSGIESWIDAAE